MIVERKLSQMYSGTKKYSGGNRYVLSQYFTETSGMYGCTLQQLVKKINLDAVMFFPLDVVMFSNVYGSYFE